MHLLMHTYAQIVHIYHMYIMLLSETSAIQTMNPSMFYHARLCLCKYITTQLSTTLCNEAQKVAHNNNST